MPFHTFFSRDGKKRIMPFHTFFSSLFYQSGLLDNRLKAERVERSFKTFSNLRVIFFDLDDQFVF